MYYKLMFLLVCGSFLLSAETVFDNVHWKLEKNHRDSMLYSFVDDGVTFYKAETEVSDLTVAEITTALQSFEKYTKVFPRTHAFCFITGDERDEFVAYSCLDFAPMKKRDAFVDMKVQYTPNETIYYWGPSATHNTKNICDDIVRVSRMFGRWTVKDIGAGKVFVSVEYSNDWLVSGVPFAWLHGIQKRQTVDAVKNLLAYTRKFVAPQVSLLE